MLRNNITKIVSMVLVVQLIFPVALFAESAGIFLQIKGDVSDERDGSSFKPSVNDVIHEKDRITTGEKARTKFKLFDDSMLTISENSSIDISELVVNEKERTSILSLTMGKAKIKVNEFLNKKSRVEIHTPTAVAAARGTEWITVVITDPVTGETESFFYVLEGTITVENPAFPGQVVEVNAGFFTSVTAGAAPAVPIAYTASMIDPLILELTAASATGAAAGLTTLTSVSVGTVIAASAVITGGILLFIEATNGSNGTTSFHD